MIWKQVDSSRVHRLFYPQVATVVTAGSKGRVGAMPAIWCMPLSFNPTLVGVAIDPEHETYKLILESEVFAINWLDCSCASRIAELGEISGREYPNKLSAVGLTAVNGKRTSQPLIQEALAVLECKIHERFRTGTHELIVGEVIEASASDFFTDYWDFSKYDPPLYAGTADGGIKSWVFMSTRGVTVRVPLKHMT